MQIVCQNGIINYNNVKCVTVTRDNTLFEFIDTTVTEVSGNILRGVAVGIATNKSFIDIDAEIIKEVEDA